MGKVIRCIHRVLQGTSNRGERCGSAKLTTKDVLDIKIAKISNWKSVCNLALKYNVSITTIYDIIKGRTWRHV